MKIRGASFYRGQSSILLLENHGSDEFIERKRNVEHARPPFLRRARVRRKAQPSPCQLSRITLHF